MTIDDFANTLRDQLISSGKAAESMVQDLEEKRGSGLFGHISTAVHASVMAQYRKSAEQLLAIVPGDSVALTALDHAEKLTARIAKGASHRRKGKGRQAMRISSLDRYVLRVCVAAALLAACGGSQPPIGAPGAMPQTRTSSGYSLLYSFGAGTDGQTPKARLIVSHRELYGTTYSVGANGMETVFKISTTGQEPVRSL